LKDVRCKVFPRPEDINPNDVPNYIEPKEEPTQPVEIGKDIDILGHKHKVTKIVLPDPKKQLHGWIEIEQRPEAKP
jgi:hypothetical protein